jgi:sporulation protein YlmC with PRC-barrel domain/CBS domain-containing protein
MFSTETSGSDAPTSAPFCFLSELLGKKVYGKSGAYLGKVDDLLVTMVEGNPYPRVDTIILLKRRERCAVPTDVAALVSLSKSSRLTVPHDECAAVVIKDNQLLLRDTLYDKQIVDVNGAKVERVNDVYILVQAGRPYVVHVDVGFTGLARRLGFERAVRRIAGTFGKKLHDELISWKFVQPFPGRVQTVRVMLRASEMKGLHPADLADILEELDRDERVSLIRTLGPEDAADALEETDLKVQAAIIRDLHSELAADIIEEMDPAAAADIIQELPVETQASIMDAMEADDRAQIEKLTKASDNTAASIMTSDYLSCRDTATAADALQILRERASEVDSTDYFYCLDADGHLLGVATLLDLLLVDAATVISTVMETRLTTVKVDDDWDAVAEHFYKYRFTALPVVSDQLTVEGIICFKHSFDELLPHYSSLARSA